FGGLDGHPSGPPNGDARIQSAPALTAQGEVVWVPSAWPSLIQLQNDHTLPPSTRSRNRARARSQAIPSTSSAAGSPRVRTSIGVPSSVTARLVHVARSVGERARNRWHHERSVVCGTSSRSAIAATPTHLPPSAPTPSR